MRQFSILFAISNVNYGILNINQQDAMIEESYNEYKGQQGRQRQSKNA